MAIHRDQPPDPNSRTQRKIDLEVCRKIGASLVALPPGKFAKLELPDALRDVVAEARRLTDPNARRRQLMLVQAAVDRCDAAQVRMNLEQIDRLPTPAKAEIQPSAPSAEMLLALRLLDGGDQAVFALASRYQASDLQTLRQAVRRAQKDLQSGKTREACGAGIAHCLDRLG